MKLSLQQYLIIFVVLLTIASGFLAYELIQEKTARDALEASHKILEKDFEVQQQKIETEIDSFFKEIQYQNEHIADVKFEIARLESTKANIKTARDEKDNYINRIADVDSMRSQITRRYKK